MIDAIVLFLQKPGELNLLEFSQREPVRGAALQLAFPSILSPHVALSLSGEQLCVYVVTARGSLHAINLPGLHEGAGNVQHSSILARVPADGSAVSSADLSNGEEQSLKISQTHCMWACMYDHCLHMTTFVHFTYI